MSPIYPLSSLYPAPAPPQFFTPLLSMGMPMEMAHLRNERNFRVTLIPGRVMLILRNYFAVIFMQTKTFSPHQKMIFIETPPAAQSVPEVRLLLSRQSSLS